MGNPVPIRLRSRHFLISGALGGLAGFVLMEAVSGLTGSGGDTRSGNLVEMGIYFAGFGLAVGAALGMTEGVVRKNRFRLWYGLVVGLVLGALGGFAGGLVGQAIYGLVPLRYASRSKADLVIVLDSSSSMRRGLFFGNDPRGNRKKAASRLIERLSSSDRVAIVDFDDQASVLFPLTPLTTSDARRRAQQAIERVDSTGGTSLDAGLSASFAVLRPTHGDGRDKHIVFLTDGQGQYTPERFGAETTAGVSVHTVGLGDGVDARLLSSIASSTGGGYYPVSDASDLISVFERIFSEHVAMTAATPDGGPGELLTPRWVLLLLRILSWGAMGMAIGLGQGVRENTREDLKACALGGLVGGLLGGALFDPVSEAAGLGAGLVGRGLADVAVGAMIGGSLRVAQRALVEKPGKPTTTLIALLPEKQGLSRIPSGSQTRARAKPAQYRAPKASDPLLLPTTPSGSRVHRERRESAPAAHYNTRRDHCEALPEYQRRYPEPGLAMALAYQSGAYTLREIAEQFGVPASSVKRAIDQHRGG